MQGRKRNLSWGRLLRKTGAGILPQVAGVAPLNDVAVLQRVAAAAIAGGLAVDQVGPAGMGAAVEFIQVLNPGDIRAAVDGRPVGFQMDAIVPAELGQGVVCRLALGKLPLGGGQNDAVGGQDLFLAGFQLIQMLEDGAAVDGDGAAARPALPAFWRSRRAADRKRKSRFFS